MDLNFEVKTTGETVIDLSVPEALGCLVKLTGALRNWSDLIRLTRVGSKKTPIGMMDTKYSDSVQAAERLSRHSYILGKWISVYHGWLIATFCVHTRFVLGVRF